MKMTRHGTCGLLIITLSAIVLTTPAVANEPLPFHFYKEVDRGTTIEDGIVQVTLDSDIYAATQDQFPDLRIFTDDGTEVPFQLEQVTASRSEKVRKPCSSEVLSLVENDDGGITVSLKLADRAPTADGISILTPLTDYERRVSVLGSSDGNDWKPMVTDGRVFDYSRFMDVNNREIVLPKNSHRQLQVVIEEVSDQQHSPLMRITRELQGQDETRRTESTTVRRRPFRIDRIECWSEETRRQIKGNKKTDYSVVGFQTGEDSPNKSTTIHLQTQREPITSLTLTTSSRNFSRLVTVQIPVERGVVTDWVEVGHATLSSVDVGGFHRERLEVTFAEQREKEYRVVIQNGDSPPLDVSGIEAEGNVYQMIFIAAGSDPMRVYFGSDSAPQPTYDISAVLASLESGYSVTEARLGAAVTNPAFGERPGTALQRLLNNGLFLTGMTCLVVAVLAWTLVRASRRIDGISDQ